MGVWVCAAASVRSGLGLGLALALGLGLWLGLGLGLGLANLGSKRFEGAEEQLVLRELARVERRQPRRLPPARAERLPQPALVRVRVRVRVRIRVRVRVRARVTSSTVQCCSASG